MRRTRENQELTVGHEKQEGNSSTDGKEIFEFLALRLSERSESERGVISRRKNHCDDRDSEKGDVELSGSNPIALLVESETSGEEAPGSEDSERRRRRR